MFASRFKQVFRPELTSLRYLSSLSSSQCFTSTEETSIAILLYTDVMIERSFPLVSLGRSGR